VISTTLDLGKPYPRLLEDLIEWSNEIRFVLVTKPKDSFCSDGFPFLGSTLFEDDFYVLLIG